MVLPTMAVSLAVLEKGTELPSFRSQIALASE